MRDGIETATAATRVPGSAASLWPPLAPLVDAERRLGDRALAAGPVARFGYEFLRFGLKQGWACLFGGLLLGLLVATRLWYPRDAPVTRYDALVVAAVLLQILLLWLRMESLQEARVILLFHGLGTLMELFKTHVGSWHYPEANLLRIGGVPLFSGFLYGSVGSYLARVWRLFDFRFTRHPRLVWLVLLSGAIYLNFFSDHYGVDIRIPLLAASAILFGRTTISFKVWRVHRRMPLLLGFLLVTTFIWLAENIATGTGAWLYPNQRLGWAMVPLAKLGSWYLLMLISYTLVAASLPRAAIETRR